MIISVTGMKRSGSTWQFNVIRFFITHAPGPLPVITATPEEAIEEMAANPNRVILCKYHPYSKELRRKSHLIFTSERRWEDAMDSLERFDERPGRTAQNRMRRWHNNWKSHSVFNMPFSGLQSDPGAMIQMIGLRLFTAGVIPELTAELKAKVSSSMDELRPPDKVDWYDPKSLLFWNHITDKTNKV